MEGGRGGGGGHFCASSPLRSAAHREESRRARDECPTITQSDNIWFTLLTMNQHPLHIDDEYGKGTEFGKTLVVSPFTVALMVGMSVSDVSQKTVANLGWTDIKMTHPLYVGDTLYAESEVIEKRESKSRPDEGIVTVKTIGKNQHGMQVASFIRSALIPKEGKAVEDKIDY